MAKYGVMHKISLAFHPQTSKQAKVSNREIKANLKKTVLTNKRDQASKFDDALWTYQTAFKTSISTSSYKLVFGKTSHLLLELKHRAYWTIKTLNMDPRKARENWFQELNELHELHAQAYENTQIYKEHVVRWHDQEIIPRSFLPNKRVLIFNSCLCLFPNKN